MKKEQADTRVDEGQPQACPPTGSTAGENQPTPTTVSRGDDTRWYIETFGAEWFILNGAGIICQGERDPDQPHDELMQRARFVLAACNRYPAAIEALRESYRLLNELGLVGSHVTIPDVQRRLQVDAATAMRLVATGRAVAAVDPVALNQHFTPTRDKESSNSSGTIYMTPSQPWHSPNGALPKRTS